jgi:cbb3-type cytochrome oxidase subunit 3
VAGNRGFWKVFGALALGGILLVVLVIAFRPLARTGAVAYAQSNLRKVAAAAERIQAQEGTFGDATRQRLEVDRALEDLLLIDPDQSSNDSEVVSVLAADGSWTGSARAETGECFWIRLEAAGDASTTVVGTGTDCSAEEASIAEAGSWPEP